MHNHTDEEFASWIQGGESHRCERKGALSSKDDKAKISKAICAFANDIAGANLSIIALGVNDGGMPSGLEITDALEQEILNIRGDGDIVPLPSFVCKRQLYQGQEILRIEVPAAISPPVRYKGAIWVRPGSCTRLASAEDEQRLNEKRRSKDQPDDCQVLGAWQLSDLNLDYFRTQYLPQAFSQEVLQVNGRTPQEQLASTKMIGSVTEPAPTVLGMLCLGLSPTDAIPGAYVQFLRIDGTSLEDPQILDQAEIQGNLADVIASTEAKFAAYNQVAIDFTSSPKEKRTSRYPRVAFEQIFRNALMHRLYIGTNAPINVYWFNDRIDITSPGGPYGRVTIENFGQPGINDYRNPNLASAMRDLNYVQRFGAGISTARKALRDNGNPDLEFVKTPQFITATLRARPT